MAGMHAEYLNRATHARRRARIPLAALAALLLAAAACASDPEPLILQQSGHSGGSLFSTVEPRPPRALSDPDPFGIASQTSAESVARYASAPFDETLYVYLPPSGFAEQGPGSVDLAISGLDVDAQRSVVGGQAQLILAAGERGRFLAD